MKLSDVAQFADQPSGTLTNQQAFLRERAQQLSAEMTLRSASVVWYPWWYFGIELRTET
jgi:hypothetical protein